MGPSHISCLSFRVIFHFYDYGRKGIQIHSHPQVPKVCQATIPISSSVSSSPPQLFPLPPWSPSLPPPSPLVALIHHDPYGPVHHDLRCLGHHGPCGPNHDLLSRQSLRSVTPPSGENWSQAVRKLKDFGGGREWQSWIFDNESWWITVWWIVGNAEYLLSFTKLVSRRTALLGVKNIRAGKKMYLF